MRVSISSSTKIAMIINLEHFLRKIVIIIYFRYHQLYNVAHTYLNNDWQESKGHIIYTLIYNFLSFPNSLLFTYCAEDTVIKQLETSIDLIQALDTKVVFYWDLQPTLKELQPITWVPLGLPLIKSDWRIFTKPLSLLHKAIHWGSK